MRWHPFLLVLLVLSAAEAAKHRYKHSHGDSDKNDENKERKNKFIDGQQVVPEFAKPGSEYRFRYDSQTTSGFAPWVSTQRAMTRFQAIVAVQFEASGNEAEMRLSECISGQLNGQPVLEERNPARIQPINAFEQNTKFAHEQLELAVRFTYAQGAIQTVHFHPDEPAWSKNAKKAVLSMLQLQLSKEAVQQQRDPAEGKIERELAEQTGTIGGRPQQQQREAGQQQLQKSFTVAEMTIEGDCEAEYTLLPIGADRLNVTKSINFDRCQMVADIAYGMQADEEGKQRGQQRQEETRSQRDWMAHLPQTEQMQDPEWRNRSASPLIAKQLLDRSTVLRYIVSMRPQQQKGESAGQWQQPGVERIGIQSVEMVSQYTLRGAQAEQSHAQQTVAAATLQFIGMAPQQKKSDSSFDAEAESLMYNADLESAEKCFFMFGDDAQGKQCTQKSQKGQKQQGSTPFPLNFPSSQAKLQRAQECLAKVVAAQKAQGSTQNDEQRTMNTAEFMDELVYLLRYCTEKELAQIEEKTKDDQMAVQFLADALAAAGTRNTLKVLLKRIEKGEFAELKAAQLMKIFSRGSGLPAPSDRIADLVLALCKTGRVQQSAVLKQTCWLSFGAIVGELQQQQRIVRLSPVRTPISTYEQCPAHKMELYVKALLEQFTSSESDVYEQVVSLKAIGNAALDSVPQQLMDAISAEMNGQQSEMSRMAIRLNAIEALRRIPSQKVQQVLLPVYLDSREQPNVRIASLAVIMQSQMSLSVSALDQIAHSLAQEKCPQVAAYTHSALQAMTKSPAKRHQTNAAHIQAALRMAGTDMQELRQRVARQGSGLSQFQRATPLWSEDSQEGIMLESAQVFPGKYAGALAPHQYISMSTLFNGKMTEEKFRLTICQKDIARLLFGGDEDGERQQQETEQQPQSKSYFSAATSQLRSIFARLGINGRQQQDEEKSKTPFIVLSLRVNNIDTIVMPIVKQQKNALSTLKQMLAIGLGSAAEFLSDGEKPAIDAAGILFWQGRVARVPISTGQQLNIQQKSFALGQLKADAKQLGRTQMDAEFRPSLIYGGIQKMKVWSSPSHSAGVKHIVAAEANIPLRATFTLQQSQQQQWKVAVRVPQSAMRLFSFHTLPTTFVGETSSAAEKSYSAPSSVPSPRSGEHFGEKVRTIQNEQLSGREFSFDKATPVQQTIVQMPFHVHGQLHIPRRLRSMKEWNKVLLASENHYQVDFEPQPGKTPHEVAFTLTANAFQPHANTPGASMRPQLRQFIQRFQPQSNEQQDGQQQSPSSASSSEESANKVERQHRQASAYLDRFGAQLAYKHSLKAEMATVGGDWNKHASVQLDSVCDARFQTCESRVQVSRSPFSPQEKGDWNADVQMRTFYPEKAADVEHFGNQQQHQRFMCSATVEWQAQGAQKQQIRVDVKGEPSVEMLHLAREYVRAYGEQNGYPNGAKMHDAPPKSTGQPFVNQFELVADYRLKLQSQNVFVRYLEAVKSFNFFNVDSQLLINNSNGQQQQQQQQKQMNGQDEVQQGRVQAKLCIDPVTRQHVNISVQTPQQLVEAKMIQLTRPIRPLPLIASQSASIRPVHSFKQLVNQIGHSYAGRSYAECRVDTRREQLQTFDGVQAPAPISKCWTVLAKDCSVQQQFAVLVKSTSNGQQKKLKVISADMGIVEVESLSDGKLQVRIQNGDGQQQVTSEASASATPDGIEFFSQQQDNKESVKIQSQSAGLMVRFNGQTARIQLSSEKQNKQCGLCGNFDGDTEDEWRTPKGTLASSLGDYQRAYSLSGSDDQEEGCTPGSLNAFYAQQEQKFAQWESGKGQRKKMNQEEEMSNNDSDGQLSQEEEEYEEQEIEPQEQTTMIEYAHQLCFSLRPVKQCPVGSYATSAVSQNIDEQELKQQKVPFTCVERSSIEAKRLRGQTRRGEVIQLDDYPASFQEVVVVPERCIQY